MKRPNTSRINLMTKWAHIESGNLLISQRSIALKQFQLEVIKIIIVDFFFVISRRVYPAEKELNKMTRDRETWRGGEGSNKITTHVFKMHVSLSTGHVALRIFIKEHWPKYTYIFNSSHHFIFQQKKTYYFQSVCKKWPKFDRLHVKLQRCHTTTTTGIDNGYA